MSCLLQVRRVPRGGSGGGGRRRLPSQSAALLPPAVPVAALSIAQRYVNKPPTPYLTSYTTVNRINPRNPHLDLQQISNVHYRPRLYLCLYIFTSIVTWLLIKNCNNINNVIHGLKYSKKK